MDGLSIKKEMAIAYVASCVTLTCTMAAMMDLAATIHSNTVSFRSAATQLQNAQIQETVPFSLLSRVHNQLPPSQHFLLTSRFRSERYENTLANGGLYI